MSDVDVGIALLAVALGTRDPPRIYSDILIGWEPPNSDWISEKLRVPDDLIAIWVYLRD
jgi:hypothetical protein